MSKNLKVHVALLIAGLIYGGNYVIAKSIMPDYVTAFGIIVIRVFFAGIFFWIFHTIFIKEKVSHPRDYRKFLFVAIFGVGVNMLAFFKGLEYTSPVNASIIMTLVPVIVLIGSYFIMKEKVTRLKLAGITLGGIGAFLLITKGEVSLENNTFIGDLLIIVNATFYGLYLVLIRPLMQRYQALTVIKWVFFFGFFMVLPFGFNELLVVDWTAIPTNIWLSIFYVNSSVAGAYIYLQPVFATFIAYFFADEILTWDKFLYAMIIFIGVYLVSKKTIPSVTDEKK
jgi:drug/metabolite transporter (DMT)-like permease